ncbi:STAS/SEC14 domain-containing protein [Halomarina oriensis]|uniref:STAS/SEC14 domain-containing protein n=2 Tax=Halomarina oriensis TaxID=671145 RepID=A0A6B0GL61_9EURY|nr:STAS/SEC14 domain-containing protein [Halomarina oriensis]
MFEILDVTDENLVAVRVGRGTPKGYDELYSLLVEKTEQHGRVRVYEEVTAWTFQTFLSHFHGIAPDLRYGSGFTISRYAAIGDSPWAKLLFVLWRAIRPVWPVAPDEMRYFSLDAEAAAQEWIQEREQ